MTTSSGYQSGCSRDLGNAMCWCELAFRLLMDVFPIAPSRTTSFCSAFALTACAEEMPHAHPKSFSGSGRDPFCGLVYYFATRKHGLLDCDLHRGDLDLHATVPSTNHPLVTEFFCVTGLYLI